MSKDRGEGRSVRSSDDNGRIQEKDGEAVSHNGGEPGGSPEVIPFQPNCDADGVQVRSELSDDGRYEYPDPVPCGVPIGYRPSPTLRDTIERIMMNHQLAVLADMEGFDSPEEAEDFEIEDDPIDPHTPYEAHFFPPEHKEELPAHNVSEASAAPSNGAPATEGGGSSSSPPPSPLASFSPDQIKLFEAFAAWQSQNPVKRSEG